MTGDLARRNEQDAKVGNNVNRGGKHYRSKKVILGLILLSALGACAAPQRVKEEAGRSLNGPCLALFLNGSLGGYQHVVHEIAGKAVFALSVDEKTAHQKCGITRSNVDVGQQAFGLCGNAVSWEQLEAIAIARCEGSGIDGPPCRIYARNNEIVWNKPSDVGFK